MAILARAEAEATREVETRGVRCGRRVGREEKGGLERRRAVDSELSLSAVAVGARRGGRRRRRSSSSGGRSSTLEVAWDFTAVV